MKMLLALAFAALIATACGGDDDGSTEITLQFAGQVGADPFECGRTYDGLGSTATTLEASDYRLFVHGIRLVDDAGEEVALQLAQDGRWQNGDIALLDFEDGSSSCESGTAETNDVVVGRAPMRTWVGLRFSMGVPFDRNHADIAASPPPLNLTSMFWDWTGGYKFLRTEGATTGDPSWRIHLGSTGCDGTGMGDTTTCTELNVAEAAIDGFDPTTGVVVADLAALVAGEDLDADLGGAPGCMSGAMDMDCAPIFENLGLPFAGAPAPGPQSFFRAR